MKLKILALLLLIISCKLAKENPTLTSKIDTIATTNHFNGVILVAKNGIIEYEKAFGYSDFENKTKLNTNNQFYIGSISKQITATLILREYEKGNLKLTNKISDYLPEISQPWANQVNIHHLLTHTHGILELDQPLEFEVGTQFHYSQIGFGLLAQILEKVKNKPFKDISNELFTHLNLPNTYYPDNRENSNLVKGYEEDETGKLVLAEGNPVKYIPAGGFISNAHDLLKWNHLLHSGKIVKPNTLNLMKTRYATRIHPILETIEYGYGLIFKAKEQEIQIGAFGYAPGFPSANYFYPQTKTDLIILENIGVHLDDFKVTFKTHTDLMELIKNEK